MYWGGFKEGGRGSVLGYVGGTRRTGGFKRDGVRPTQKNQTPNRSLAGAVIKSKERAEGEVYQRANATLTFNPTKVGTETKGEKGRSLLSLGVKDL